MFTYQHYSATLKKYIEEGYKISSFEKFLTSPAGNKTVILRHDVDFDVNAAWRMAQVDHAAGISSTFFFRIHATGYNLFTLDNLKCLKKIRNFGHELGLHLEPGIGPALNTEAVAFADRQKDAFEAAIGEKILGFSTHEPARADNPDLVEILFKRWALKYHAYHPIFFKEMKYISDSGGRWREGCFSEWINKAHRLQVLVHPIWWYESYTQENY